MLSLMPLPSSERAARQPLEAGQSLACAAGAAPGRLLAALRRFRCRALTAARVMLQCKLTSWRQGAHWERQLEQARHAGGRPSRPVRRPPPGPHPADARRRRSLRRPRRV